jgi:hypothetical protein
MAQVIRNEDLEALEAAGKELFDLAMSMAERYTLLDVSVAPEANEVAVKVQALVLAANGLLTGAAQSEGITIVGLGAACGCALGKCIGDRRVLFAGFQDQFKRALDEVREADRPKGTA